VASYPGCSLRRPALGDGSVRKRFSFEKKKQKTFVYNGLVLAVIGAPTFNEAAARPMHGAAGTASSKSFLLLFCKKEGLALPH
jgi:hypothetical protein